MKANELMVGDYLRVYRDGICIPKGKIVRVSEIDSENTFREKGLKGSARCEAVGDPWLSGGIWCDYLDPIPLTPEILEKNGFKDIDKEDNCDGYDIYWTTGDGFSINTQDLHLHYVHELQHALRLCGIEKEITP